jgi:chromosome segregation ATPase
MQIDPTLLSEKNYTGTRLVEVNDPKIKELKAKLKKIQVEEVNPILDSTEPLLKILDPYYAKIRELRESIRPILEKAKPLQEEYEKHLATIDPESKEERPELEALAQNMKKYIDEIHDIEAKIDEIKKEMQPTKDEYEKEMKKVEIIDQRAQLIKQKLVPLVNKAIEKELGEFERATQIIERDEQLFVEIIDAIEEHIKQLRAEKLENA